VYAIRIAAAIKPGRIHVPEAPFMLVGYLQTPLRGFASARHPVVEFDKRFLERILLLPPM
jgi:hypothetical protein